MMYSNTDLQDIFELESETKTLQQTPEILTVQFDYAFYAIS